MPKRTRPSSNAWPSRPAYAPLPHPSWAGELPLTDLAQPLLAAEFWKRLGL